MLSKAVTPPWQPRHAEGEEPNACSTPSLGGAGPGMPGFPSRDSVQTLTAALPEPSRLGSHCKCHLCTLVLELRNKPERTLGLKGEATHQVHEGRCLLLTWMQLCQLTPPTNAANPVSDTHIQKVWSSHCAHHTGGAAWMHREAQSLQAQQQSH